jgi:predicted RNA-binding Zn-ribbon protein involved in translation (DUF1610 family)
METFIFDGIDRNLQKALDVNAVGGKVLCPKCGAELIIAANKAAAEKMCTSPGILCPVNKRHMERVFILAEEQLAFDRWCEEMKGKGYFKSNRD